MFKGVEVTKVNTMADGTIRLTIDLQDGTSDDIKAAYQLMHTETSMLLASNEGFVAAMQELVQNYPS
jgi:hypothetical protein